MSIGLGGKCPVFPGLTVFNGGGIGYPRRPGFFVELPPMPTENELNDMLRDADERVTALRGYL